MNQVADAMSARGQGTSGRPRPLTDEQILRGLADAAAGTSSTAMDILSRQPNPYASSGPSEIANVRHQDGSETAVLCKCLSASRDRSFGHRGHDGYEAEVYRVLLSPRRVRPSFLGVTSGSDGASWMLLEYIPGARHLQQFEQPERGVLKAADWIGTLQASAGSPEQDQALDFVTRYDWRFFSSWAERTLAYAGPARKDRPWLDRLCRWYVEDCAAHYSGPVTVIHGEYTPMNVLADHTGAVFPVDWETAAMALGEIDLVALTEFWGPDTVRSAIDRYAAARWRGDTPAGFEARIGAARLYWTFRWLGDRPEWTQHDVNRPRWQRLLEEARALGFEHGNDSDA